MKPRTIRLLWGVLQVYRDGHKRMVRFFLEKSEAVSYAEGLSVIASRWYFSVVPVEALPGEMRQLKKEGRL